MDHNTHESRKVADVFSVRSGSLTFQRRYRWTPDHIIQLLEDINQFSLESDEKRLLSSTISGKKREDSYRY